eukprot:8352779-Prorocentrum_lima.AAC.1
MPPPWLLLRMCPLREATPTRPPPAGPGRRHRARQGRRRGLPADHLRGHNEHPPSHRARAPHGR